MVELVEVGTSAILGVVDVGLTYAKEKGMLKGNLTYLQDIIRIGAGFGGLLYNYFMARGGLEYDISEALALAGLPLAFHSIYNLAKGFSFKYSSPSPVVSVVNAPRSSPVLEAVTSY